MEAFWAHLPSWRDGISPFKEFNSPTPFLPRVSPRLIRPLADAGEDEGGGLIDLNALTGSNFEHPSAEMAKGESSGRRCSTVHNPRGFLADSRLETTGFGLDLCGDAS